MLRTRFDPHYFLVKVTAVSGSAYSFDEWWLTSAGTAAKKEAGRYGDTASNPGRGVTGATFSVGDFALCRAAEGAGGLEWELVPIGSTGGGGGGSGVTVAEVDGTPSYAGVTALRFDQADGFVLSQPSAGIARVDLAAATASQAGVVSTGTQTFGGAKTFATSPLTVGADGPTLVWSDPTSSVSELGGVTFPQVFGARAPTLTSVRNYTLGTSSTESGLLILSTDDIIVSPAAASSRVRVSSATAGTVSTGQTGTLGPGAKAVHGFVTDLGTGSFGTVTSISGGTSGGVTITVTNPTTTPALSISLGAITPGSVTTPTINQTAASASSTPLTITGAPSQTAPLFQLLRSGGANLLSVGPGSCAFTTDESDGFKFNAVVESLTGFAVAGVAGASATTGGATFAGGLYTGGTISAGPGTGAAYSVLGVAGGSSATRADIAATVGSGSGVLVYSTETADVHWEQTPGPAVLVHDGAVVSWAVPGGNGVFVATAGVTIGWDSVLPLTTGGTGSDLSATGPGVVVQASAGSALTVQSYSTFRATIGAQAADADLTALAALASTGFAVRTAADTWALRKIVAGANVAVTNGDGVAGDATVAVTGLAAVATSGSAADLSAGTLPAARMPALTGDVTTTAGTVATTIGANAVTDTKLRDSAALSVIGRSANSTGDPADIAAGTDGHVLRRSGTALGFGTLASGAFADNTIAPARVAFAATARLLGRTTAGAGAGEEISVGAGLSLSAGSLACTVAGVPAGAVMAFAFSAAPSGWLACDGTAVSRTTYAALFSAVGTTWGAGDGSTTFNLPDLRRRTLLGSGGTQTNGTGPATAVGSTGGAERVTLTAAEMPAHTHSIGTRTRTAAATGNAAEVELGDPGQGTGTATSGSTGSGGAHDNLPPAAVVLWCIKT